MSPSLDRRQSLVGDAAVFARPSRQSPCSAKRSAGHCTLAAPAGPIRKSGFGRMTGKTVHHIGHNRFEGRCTDPETPRRVALSHIGSESRLVTVEKRAPSSVSRSTGVGPHLLPAEGRHTVTRYKSNPQPPNAGFQPGSAGPSSRTSHPAHRPPPSPRPICEGRRAERPLAAPSAPSLVAVAACAPIPAKMGRRELSSRRMSCKP
jgi:hypothetical protein